MMPGLHWLALYGILMGMILLVESIKLRLMLDRLED